MKLTAVAKEVRAAGGTEAETVVLSSQQVAYLERLCGGMEPVFGRPHVIRTLIECIERSGIDLSEASSEQELTQLAAISFSRAGGRTQRQPVAIVPISVASATSQPSGRRSNRSNPPAKDRHHSGKRPRSNRG